MMTKSIGLDSFCNGDMQDQKVLTLFTLEYDCTDTLCPMYADIFKADLTGAYILRI